MTPSRSNFISAFTALNIAQFCTTLNENLFKLLLAFFLISIHGPEKTYTILSLAGAVFVAPFILCASTAGTLADRFSKSSIIYVTRALEILSTLVGILAFAYQSAFLGYAVLFLLSIQGAIFSPCKYGIIPEIVPPEKVSHYNGLITATTYLAIIVGTFLASLLTQTLQGHYVLASCSTVLIAIIGAIGTLWLPKTAPQAHKTPVSFNIVGGVFKTLKRSRDYRYLFQSIFFGSYFLFMAGYTQLNMIPFVTQSLGLSEVMGGYVFLLTALGIGIGSYFAGQFSGEEAEVGLAPLAAIGSGLTFLFLYFNSHSLIAVLSCLILLGFFGGFYIVPIEIFIQVASPPKDRGQNLAAANFLNFLGVISSSIFLAFCGNVLNITAAGGFAIIGFFACLLGAFLCLLFADQVSRMLLSVIARLFWNIKIVGKRRLVKGSPVMIVGQRRSWLDIVILMAILPRHVRYIVPVDAVTKRHPMYYKLLKVIPLDKSCYTPVGGDGMGLEALEEIKKELDQGHSVCIMHPNDFENPQMKQWREKVEQWVHDVELPAIPLYISHEGSLDRDHRVKQFFSLFGKKVKVGFGLPIH